jgi:hypothetical protein
MTDQPPGTIATVVPGTGIVYSTPQGVAYQAALAQYNAQLDAQQEALKQANAFSQIRDDTAFTHSAAYDAITQQYAAVQNSKSASVPGYSYSTPSYNTNTAAGIAAMLGSQGGAVNPYLGLTARQEGYTGPITLPTYQGTNIVDYGQNVVATPTLKGTELPTYLTSGSPMLGNTVTSFVPYGSYTQERLDNTKILVGRDTGEVGIYAPEYVDGKLRGYGLISSGGRNALQSGMFTIDRKSVV